MIGITNSIESSKIPKNYAVLKVIVQSGGILTVSKNGISINANATVNNISITSSIFVDEYYYYISPNNFGEWTVLAVINEENYSSLVTIDENKNYEVSLKGRHYIIKDGKFVNGYEHSYTAGKTGSFDENSDGYVLLHAASGSGTWVTGYFSPKYEFIRNGYWTTLSLDCQHRGYSDATHPCFGLTNNTGSNPDMSYYLRMATSTTNTFSTRAVKTLDISGIDKSYSFVFKIAGASSNSTQGDIRAWNFYLS